MSTLDSYILNTDRIAPSGDSNIQLRRVLWHMANLNASGLSSGMLSVQGVQDDDLAVASNDPVLVGGVTADPAALPADTVAGRVKRFLTNLKGILFVHQSDLNRSYDSVTNYPVANSLASAIAAASLVARGSAGTLVGVSGFSDAAGAQYIQIHDSATLPADTAVPVFSQIVAADSNFFIPIPDGGVGFANGIVVCNSSTAATKTIGAADCNFSVVHRAV